MPYTLTFNGNFFKIADFIKGLDSLVKTTNEKVAVNGRLVTINGFSLAAGRPASPPCRRPSRHHLPDPAQPGGHRRRLTRRAEGRHAGSLDHDRRHAMKRPKKDRS